MEEKTTKIAIYGAGGLTGRELLRLLRQHPFAEPVFVSSNKYAGTKVASVFPELAFYDAKETAKIDAAPRPLLFSKHDAPLPPDVELALLATPNETSLELLPRLLAQGRKAIDLSGSFRLSDQKVWESFYKLKHTAFELIQNRGIVFGLPEVYRSQIPKAQAVANPGCYPTAAIVALNILGDYQKQLAFVSIDAKSGVSGAGGRTEDAGFSFRGVYENFRAYKILRHQHEPEIIEHGFEKKPPPCPLVFTPHLLPLDRGILSTIVLHWKGAAPPDLKERFCNFASKEPFVRFYEEPEEIELQKVQHSNFLDMALRTRGNVTVLVCAIDNLIKGAAGQAIQNLNLMCGFPESTGLR